ncbi:MAG: gamma-glutamyl-gamma-aminobutyrate hydrolase family protein [Verrucomicrobia bacterium]|nr:gamma-glutamyl-gamma-aminobutyrate hydrolase family protein [Verrucomicrobiota bacterium]
MSAKPFILVLALACADARAEKTNFTSGILAGISGVFDDLGSLAGGPPTVCHINCHHPDSIREALKKPATGHIAYLAKVKCIVEQQTGLPYAVVHYSQLSGGSLDRTRIKAVLITMMDKGISSNHTARLLATIRATNLPTFGFCGGHQLIAEAFGGKVAKMRPLAPGEKDPHPARYPGLFKEWAFLPVKIVRRDPLFDGFGETVVVREYHAYEIKRLPEEFDLLASNDACRVQAIKHKSRLLYGTQFHPEHFDAGHPDGERMLRNFFKIAGILKPEADKTNTPTTP